MAKTMLFTMELITKSVFRTKQQLFKQSLFYCSASNENIPKPNELQPIDNERLCQKSLKFLKIAILGLPNAGKSTLVNRLVRRMICPTSSKVHTTMHKAEAVYSEGETQIVFMDTPGLITSYERKRYNLNKTFQEDPTISIQEANVIGIIQDVTNVHTRYTISNFIIEQLKTKKDDVPLLLIFNKIDKLKHKGVLLNLTTQIIKNENLPKFNDIFMISALSGDGVDDLRNYLLDCAKERDWQYNGDMYTDQSIETIIGQTVRAKLMDYLPNNIPYDIKVKLEYFNIEEDGNASASIILNCSKNYYKTALLKNKGEVIKLVALAVEKELRHAFRTNVLVRLSVE